MIFVKIWNIFVLVLLTAVSGLPHDGYSMDNFQNKLNSELNTLVETREVGNFLKQLSKELDIQGLLYGAILRDGWKETKISLFCTTCHTIVNRILAANTTTEIFDLGYTLCIDLGIGNSIYCEGIIAMNEPTIIWLVENSVDETGKDICGILFIPQGCTTDDPRREWSVELPNVPKPPISEPSFPQNPPSTLKILHLADTHFDPNYVPGSNAVCPEVYFCCNLDSGDVQNSEDAAGYWGDYRNCDLPLWTLELLYQDIVDNHPDIDIILWTGDLEPHKAWDETKAGNLDIVNQMNALVRNYFSGIPVFPAVGNHEAVPLSFFSQPYIEDPEFSMAWLYTDLANLWNYWLPTDTVKDILYSAYYSTQIRQGLRVVSINTNWNYGNNWWLIYDSTDIASELLFLANELQAAEDVGDFVYIIGHHPPGFQGAMFTWSREFSKIISRYEDTVTGMFFSHTHYDHYELFFDPDNSSRVFDIAYIAQSQTTFFDLNPGYKIYTVEGDFEGSRYRVLEHDNYVLDLDEANVSNVTNIFKMYTASEEYGLSDLSPQSWLDLVKRMQDDDNLFNTFYRNYVKGGTPAVEAGCTGTCKDHMLCRLLMSDNSDHSQCKDAGLE